MRSFLRFTVLVKLESLEKYNPYTFPLSGKKLSLFLFPLRPNELQAQSFNSTNFFTAV